MPLTTLQHVNIRCADAKRSRDFYVNLLGLRQGPRPPFVSQGYWLYLGEQPVVHLVQRPAGERAHPPQTGNLDHIALSATDVNLMRQMLQAADVTFRESVVPRDNTIQIFVLDPDGVPLELNFQQ